MNIKTLIFDFGNVVGYFDHYRALNRLAPYAGISAEEMRAFIVSDVVEHPFESNRLDTESYICRVMEHCQLRCTKEQFVSWFSDIFWPNPTVCELLPRLKTRFRLVLGSNTNHLHSRQFLRQFAKH